MPSRIVHDSETIRIGAFRSRTDDDDFTDSGPTRGHLLVFPREAVTITHAGRRPIVADPTLVMIYNRGQRYTRAAISPAGDRCEWFAYPASAVIDAHLAYRMYVHDDERPFGALTHVPGDARAYLLARLAFDHVAVDPLFAEEAAATLLDHVLRGVAADRPPALSRAHAELADATRRWLDLHHTDRCTLGELSRVHGVSPFHLARVFRRATGRTIHAYRTELRLRGALELLADATDLSRVALELGFSSHSHFTAAFRRAFGIPPSHLRTPGKILTAARTALAR